MLLLAQLQTDGRTIPEAIGDGRTLSWFLRGTERHKRDLVLPAGVDATLEVTMTPSTEDLRTLKH